MWSVEIGEENAWTSADAHVLTHIIAQENPYTHNCTGRTACTAQNTAAVGLSVV